MGKKVYSVSEAAEVLGLSPATVRSYCSKGKLPAMKVGRRYKIG